MKNKPMYKKSFSEKVFYGILYFIFTLYCLSIVFVLGWALLSSFKNNWEFFDAPLKLPEKWLFSNYKEALDGIQYKNTGFIGMIFNSLWQTLGGIFISTMSTAVFGYVFAKYSFRGKEVMYAVIITVMTLPIMSTGAAGYKLIYTLQINDSPLYLITSIGAYGMNFLLYYAMFKGVSWSYAEAAFIDGAGPLYTYLKVMLPMVLPGILALSLNAFIAGWNDYMTSLMYLQEMPSLAAGLYFFRDNIRHSAWDPIYFAGAIMSAILPVTLFSLFQDKIMDKVSFGGGLKG